MDADLASAPVIGSGWLAVGLLGNAVFGARFIVQWAASERAGRSVIPDSFWLLSLAGSSLLLAYAVARRDPVLLLANLPNGLVYLRNLALVRRTGATS
jgi:lipid-A-disaccharide synthase-like uncharacterized protein